MLKTMTYLPKRFLFMLCACFIVLIGSTSFAKEITLTLDGKEMTASVAPIQENGTTLVPLRIISENLNAFVGYDASTQTASILKGSTAIHLTIGSKKVSVNNNVHELPVAPRLINNTTMVPIRFISEYLGCKVDWDSLTQTVILVSPVTTQKLPLATIKLKDVGTIQAELYPEYAPNTVNNFIFLANNHFYDGLTFHRVVKDFMIQGGSPSGDGLGGPNYSILGEFSTNGYQNPLRHTPGVLSMARKTEPNTAGSQFFIMTGEDSSLDGSYAAFGKVINGLNKVLELGNTPTDEKEVPLTPIVIESITVETFGTTYPSPLILKE